VGARELVERHIVSLAQGHWLHGLNCEVKEWLATLAFAASSMTLRNFGEGEYV
jgi:hypothetical protein